MRVFGLITPTYLADVGSPKITIDAVIDTEFTRIRNSPAFYLYRFLSSPILAYLGTTATLGS